MQHLEDYKHIQLLPLSDNLSGYLRCKKIDASFKRLIYKFHLSSVNRLIGLNFLIKTSQLQNVSWPIVAIGNWVV